MVPPASGAQHYCPGARHADHCAGGAHVQRGPGHPDEPAYDPGGAVAYPVGRAEVCLLASIRDGWGVPRHAVLTPQALNHVHRPDSSQQAAA
jgi:hypothetical protein